MHTLPRLACITDEEWIDPDLFNHTSITCCFNGLYKCDKGHVPIPSLNSSQKIKRCAPGTWKVKNMGMMIVILCIVVVSFIVQITCKVVSMHMYM